MVCASILVMEALVNVTQIQLTPAALLVANVETPLILIASVLVAKTSEVSECRAELRKIPCTWLREVRSCYSIEDDV